MKKTILLTTVAVFMAGSQLFAAASTPPRDLRASRDRSSSLDSVDLGGFTPSRSDGALSTPHRGVGGTPARGRAATDENAPSIFDKSQPHGFDMDQVVINQHEGRAQGKGNMLETGIVLYAKSKYDIANAESTLKKLGELRSELERERQKHPIRPTAASKERIAVLEKKIEVLSKKEPTYRLTVANPDAALSVSRDMIKSHLPDITDAQLAAIPADLPKYGDAKKRKEEKMKQLASRKIRFAPTPTR